MPSVPLNFPVSARLSCTHYPAPSQAGLLYKPGPGWRGWLLAGLGCGAHPKALLQCLEQHLLETSLLDSVNTGCRGEAGELICGCLQQLAVVGKRVSETQEKRKGALKPIFSVPPWPVLVPILFSPGLHSFHSSLGCQPMAVLSASIMGYWQLQCMSLHGTEFRHLPGLGARGVGRPVRYTEAEILQRQPLLSRSRQFQCQRPKSPKLAARAKPH